MSKSLVMGVVVLGVLVVGAQADLIVSKSVLDESNPQNATIYKDSADTVYQPANWKYRNEVRGENSSLARKAYYKFDLSGIPVGELVESASLTFYFQTSGSDASDTKVHGFGIYGVTAGDDAWTGNDITWNNTLSDGDFDYLGNVDLRYTVAAAKTTLLGTFTYTGRTTAGLEMTISGQDLVDFLNARSDATGYATFIITGYDGANMAAGVHYIATGNPAQASWTPTLKMVVPEPGTIALVAAGLAGIICRRKHGCR